MNGQMQKLFRMFLVSILMLFTFTVNAQEQTITGKVYDVAGEPIIGANVLIQGTTQGVITDMEGAFQLKSDPSQSLVISFLGYKDMIPMNIISVYYWDIQLSVHVIIRQQQLSKDFPPKISMNSMVVQLIRVPKEIRKNINYNLSSAV